MDLLINVKASDSFSFFFLGLEKQFLEGSKFRNPLVIFNEIAGV